MRDLIMYNLIRVDKYQKKKLNFATNEFLYDRCVIQSVNIILSINFHNDNNIYNVIWTGQTGLSVI